MLILVCWEQCSESSKLERLKRAFCSMLKRYLTYLLQWRSAYKVQRAGVSQERTLRPTNQSWRTCSLDYPTFLRPQLAFRCWVARPTRVEWSGAARLYHHASHLQERCISSSYSLTPSSTPHIPPPNAPSTAPSYSQNSSRIASTACPPESGHYASFHRPHPTDTDPSLSETSW